MAGIGHSCMHDGTPARTMMKRSIKFGDLARNSGVTLRTLHFMKTNKGGPPGPAPPLLKPNRVGVYRLFYKRDRAASLILLRKRVGFADRGFRRYDRFLV